MVLQSFAAPNEVCGCTELYFHICKKEGAQRTSVKEELDDCWKTDAEISIDGIQNVEVRPSSDGQKRNAEKYYESDAQADFCQESLCAEIASGQVLCSDSYMNLFDLDAWHKYTRVQRISLDMLVEGEGTVRLYQRENREEIQASLEKDRQAYLSDHFDKTGESGPVVETESNGEEKRKEQDTKMFCEQSFSGRAHIKLPLSVKTGQIFFELSAKKLTKLMRADYCCGEQPDTVNLSLVICTYHRKAYIEKNLRLLKTTRFWDARSDNYGHLEVHVVDNASELSENVNEVLFCPAEECEDSIGNVSVGDFSDMDSEKDWIGGPFAGGIADAASGKENTNHIWIYHNPNEGGSGGFARGMREVRGRKPQYPCTHLILMDDDVEFLPETFYRIYALCAYRRKAYADTVIAGRMFRTDRRTVQYTASETWNAAQIIHAGENTDCADWTKLSDINRQCGEYSGWWLAVFPFSFVEKELPLPFFLHCDDVEYGLRHGGGTMVLNGIQVWHETFEYRRSAMIAYYDMRNSLIVNTMYAFLDTEEKILQFWQVRFFAAQRDGAYAEAAMMLRALWDYADGAAAFQKVILPKDCKRFHDSSARSFLNRGFRRIVEAKLHRRFGRVCKELQGFRREL